MTSTMSLAARTRSRNPSEKKPAITLLTQSHSQSQSQRRKEYAPNCIAPSFKHASRVNNLGVGCAGFYLWNMLLDQMGERCADLFRKCFGHAPRWVAAAPGRVNLIGEHTDYNDGFVLPMAIERYTVMAAAPNETRQMNLRSAAAAGIAAVDLDRPIERGQPDWANYARGVIAGFQRLGWELKGCDVLIASNVPLGGGLSSSAALEVATATLVEAIAGRALTPMEKALLCQRAEHEFAGVPCGIMDQVASVLAEENQLLLLDCRSRTIELVPMTDPSIKVLVINTNVRHELTGGEYALRRRQCEAAARGLEVPALRDASIEMLHASRDRLSPETFKRARHVITEIDRTLRAARAIVSAQWPAVGALMDASHASLRDDFEVSCPELDLVVEIAQSIGASGRLIGCRMTGGGFGGRS